jgi:hypothetical protein
LSRGLQCLFYAFPLREIAPMTQWEYRKIDLSGIHPRSDEVELLNGAGRDGWELLTITANNMAYLKRPIQVAAVQKTTTPASRRGAARPD